jgi:ankyrin repeat protein
VQYLLERGASAEAQGYLGMKPLHHACSGSHDAAVAALLEAGAAVDSTDEVTLFEKKIACVLACC